MTLTIIFYRLFGLRMGYVYQPWGKGIDRANQDIADYALGREPPNYPPPALIIDVEYCPICPCWELWIRGRENYLYEYAGANVIEIPPREG